MATASDMPTAEAVFAELVKLPIGREVEPDHLRSFSEIAHFEQLGAGTVLQREAERVCELRIVLSGRIALTLPVPGGEVASVGTLSRGELLGWSCLIGGGAAKVRATIVKPTRCLAFPGDRIQALFEQDHELGYHLTRHALSVVIDRLSDAYLQLLDIYGRRG